MAATMKKAAAEDVNVTFEDQQKINKFARNTSRITELKEEIEVKKKQLQNLEDACDDIMLAEDDCLMIPYQIGDVFISHSQEETQEMLEEAKKYSPSAYLCQVLPCTRAVVDSREGQVPVHGAWSLDAKRKLRGTTKE
ncbi:PREDICTED: prefoldin subunit 4 isoform X1 [Chinchilla lanigera]|uniref:prefoldin subunit 4 isoform X1 n=1 Tax=Chinchilla lanigera TaxID=34839 RepID=UPI00069746C5|nr:PREDICTED: prefoldin subunit 4 isoform X1 [Chinchilla lanigera]